MATIKRKDFDSVIRAFDMTIQHAIDSREPIPFNCVEIPTVVTKESKGRWHDCPSYCPMYHDGVSDDCVIKRSANEWIEKKKEFINSVTIKISGILS